jgi:protein TonB
MELACAAILSVSSTFFFNHHNIPSMQPTHVMHSSLLDIVFDQRNKDYGAYTLRKYYPKRLAAGLVISLLFGTVVILLLAKWARDEVKTVSEIIPVELSRIDPADLILPPPPPPPPVPASKRAPSAMIVDVVPVIVPDRPVTDPVPTQEEKNAAESGNIHQAGNTEGINTGGPGNSGTAGNVNEANVTPPLIPEIYDAGNVDEPADFPGGKPGLSRFLQRNLVSPGMEENHSVQVLVRFVVDKEGKIAAAEIVKEGGKVYDEEVLRVIRKMPKWKPARQHGNPVPMYFVLPVTFVAGSDH